jgi:hypothetical protein
MASAAAATWADAGMTATAECVTTEPVEAVGCGAIGDDMQRENPSGWDGIRADAYIAVQQCVGAPRSWRA